MHIFQLFQYLIFDICIPAESFFARQIEVTLNGGRHWRLANINRYEQPNVAGKYFCWIFWSCLLGS